MEEEYTEDKQIILEDKENDLPEDRVANAMIDYVSERYIKAEDSRRIDEERWLRAYRNYRGIYGPDVQFTEVYYQKV